MGKVLIEEENLTNIANSIRAKTGSTDTMTPGEMPTNIGTIESGDSYFNTTYNESNTCGYWVRDNFIKDLPDIVIDDSIVNLEYFARQTNLPKCPKLIGGTNVTNMQYLYYGNSNFTEIDISKLVTINVTDMNNMFSGNSKLTNIIGLDKLDVSNVTNMSSMFNGTALSEIDVSNFNFKEKVILNSFLANNSNLTTVNLGTRIIYPKSTGSMFRECSNLVSLDISMIDFSNVIGNSGSDGTANSMFYRTTNLENLIFGTNLGKGYSVSTNYAHATFTLSDCTKLTHDSLMDVINKIYDLNLISGGTLRTQKLILGETNLAKLTEDEIAIATANGWIVS